MSLFVFLYGLWFKVYLVWYEYWNSCFLSGPWAWNIFSHPLTFILCVSVALRWVSCRQKIEGFCFFIESASLCLLIWAFSPLTFKGIIDRYVLIAILNLVFQLSLCFSYVHSFFFCFVLFWCFIYFMHKYFSFQFLWRKFLD